MKSMLVCLGALFSMTAQADGTTVSEKDYQLPKCQAPVASVVVGKISCSSAKCAPAPGSGDNSTMGAIVQFAAAQKGMVNFAGIGDGMSSMLVTALRETRCFDIQERGALDEMRKELELVGKKVEVQQADYMILGSITSIDMSTEKSTLGGGFIPILGYFSSTKKTADLGMDIKIVNINNSKIVESKTFEGNNVSSSQSFGGIAFGGVGAAGGGFSSIKGTPMEQVVRDVLTRVASFSSSRLLEERGVTNAVFSVPQAASAPQ